MDKTSPREILLNYGKWIGSTDFAKLIAKKRSVTERQAKNLINKVYRNKEIKRFIFPDRSVIYGLAEFGPPTNDAIPTGTTSSGANFQSTSKDHQDGVTQANANSVAKNIETHRVVQTRSFGVGETVIPPLPDILRVEAENNIRIIEEARRELRFFREPTVEEIAAKIGCHPEDARFILNEFVNAGLTDWREQSGQEAEKEAKDAITLAGLLFLEKEGQQTRRLKALCEKVKSMASSGVRKRAEDILKNYPDMVPKAIWESPELDPKASKRPIGKGVVVPDPEVNWIVLQWPDETNIKWRQIFHSEPPQRQYWNA